MKVIKNLQILRNGLYALIGTTIVLALAVNLIAYGLCELSNNKQIYLYIGIAILAVCLISYTLIAFKNINNKKKILGFYIIDHKNKKFIEVPQYELSIDMIRYIEAAYSENNAIKKLIEEDNFEPKLHELKNNEFVLEKTEGLRLIEELVFYCILEKLSVYTSDYFNQNNMAKYITTLGKEDISSIILSNRFLKLFLEPMENREKFIESNSIENIKKDKSNVISAYSNGALYEKLQLSLPKKTIIKKINNNSFEINMKFVTIIISIECKGFSTCTSKGFDEFYLNKEKDSKYNAYQCEVNIYTKFKKRYILTSKNIKIYEWIDGFLNNLEQYISEQYFYAKIQWPTIYAQTLVNLNTISKKQ